MASASEIQLDLGLSKPHISKPLKAAITMLANGNESERGAIFTRREVVDFILDLSGYTVDQPLYQLRMLEPCFGEGDFLIPIIERLVSSYQAKKNTKKEHFLKLKSALRAVELHETTFQKIRVKLRTLLSEKGFDKGQITELMNCWLVEGDFLLVNFETKFNFVVGNPPYIRQELIPAALIAEYRRRYITIYDRADIYIPFIEKSLSLLDTQGVLGFICSDRWMKNKYGGPLRRMVHEGYRLKYYVDMTDTQAFHSEVTAYPAITVITREMRSETILAQRPKIDKKTLLNLSKKMICGDTKSGLVKQMTCIASGSSPWILESSDQVGIVRLLESKFPLLEESGCRVGIGVATGADKIFINKFHDLDVESDRKIPLAMTRDIDTGIVKWQGYGVINPFNNDGTLVKLKDYPRFARYMNNHREIISARHVSKKNPNNWFRTIDRITPSLAETPKLLIPDIKGKANVVFEEGRLYPHHNLYYITSTTWDLRALQAILMSGIARLFVAAYSTQMRGGYLRFQAQYLRRIRIPHWNDLPIKLQADLIEAANQADTAKCNELAFKVYGLNNSQRLALSGIEK